HLGVVGRADKDRVLAERGLLKAEPDDVDSRHEDDEAQHQLRRRDQAKRRQGPRLLVLHVTRCLLTTSRSISMPRPGPCGTSSCPSTSPEASPTGAFAIASRSGFS